MGGTAKVGEPLEQTYLLACTNLRQTFALVATIESFYSNLAVLFWTSFSSLGTVGLGACRGCTFKQI